MLGSPAAAKNSTGAPRIGTGDRSGGMMSAPSRRWVVGSLLPSVESSSAVRKHLNELGLDASAVGLASGLVGRR